MTAGALLMSTLAAPLIGAVLIVLCRKSPNLRETMTLATSVVLFALVVSLYMDVESLSSQRVVLVQMLPELDLALCVEPLGMLFALLASFLWIVTSVYAIGYMRGHGESNQTRFYVCFAIAIASVMGIAFAANMVTLFVFYEVLTLSTYPLVTHSGTPEARRAGKVYLGLLLGTSIGLQLVAIIWTWTITGTLEFTPGGVFAEQVSGGVLAVLTVLYVLGVGKAAVMPVHRWLPNAMVAPTPVSALLHAVAVVKAGVFTILKVSVYIFGLDALSMDGVRDLPLYLAGATVLLSSLVAMRQNNLKARLAYSTVGQLSYVVVGALLANELAVIGSGMHLFMHGFAKITLFFCAGAILVAAHKTEVSQLDGLGKTMPFTMAAFFVAALSVVGLPPTGGAWSKWFLVLGTLEAQQSTLLVVLMLSSLLNVSYLMSIPIRAFFRNSQSDGEEPKRADIKEAPWACLLAIGVTTSGCVALFLYPTWLHQLLLRIFEG